MGFFDFLKKKQPTPQPFIKTSLEEQNNTVSHKNIQLSQEELEHQINFKKNIKKSIPSNRGLYPHEILMLHYAHTYKQTNNTFQSFWYYKYDVINPQDILDSLVMRGFMEVGDLESTLSNETNTKLKGELKSFGLKQTGKKADLVQRLVTEGNITILNEKYKNRRYKLTTNGEAELKANQYVTYIHRTSISDLDIWILNRLINTPPAFPYRDKIWGYLNNQSMIHYSTKDFGLYRNVRLNMFDFLIEEKKYKLAFPFIAEVIYFDLSGVSNGYQADLDVYLYKTDLAMNFPYEKSCATIPPGILLKLQVIAEALELTDEQLIEELNISFNVFHAPKHLFTIPECIDITLAELHEDKEKLTQIYAIAEKRFRHDKPKLKR